MTEVTKDMIIGDIIRIDNGIVPILMNAGLHCVGCPSAQMETIEEAGVVHGMNIDGLIEEINSYLASRG